MRPDEVLAGMELEVACAARRLALRAELADRFGWRWATPEEVAETVELLEALAAIEAFAPTRWWP